MQEINRFFDEKKRYPQLADVLSYYNNLLHFKSNKDYLKQQFPCRLTAIYLQQLNLLYQSVIKDDDLMTELTEIITYALRKMKGTIEGGTAL